MKESTNNHSTRAELLTEVAHVFQQGLGYGVLFLSYAFGDGPSWMLSILIRCNFPFLIEGAVFGTTIILHDPGTFQVSQVGSVRDRVASHLTRYFVNFSVPRECGTHLERA